MKKNYYTLLLMFLTLPLSRSFSQIPEDVVKYSWFSPFGTARFNGVAGSSTAIGGDLSSLNTNPAGIGFVRKSEWVIGGNFYNSDYSTQYRGTKSTYLSSDISSNLGLTGLTIPIRRTKWTFGFTVNTIATFDRSTRFSGLNNYSSITNAWLDKLINDNADTNDALFNYPFDASLAFRNYLIDTSNLAPFYKTLVPYNTTGTIQSFRQIESGSYRETSFGFGGEVSPKLTIGATLVIPSINYKRRLVYNEDKNPDFIDNKGFQYLEYDVVYSTDGTGFGLKLGAIFKPIQRVNLGLSLHSPQTLYLKDEISTALFSNVGTYDSSINRSSYSEDLNNGYPGSVDYIYRTPARAQFSAGYIFGNLTEIKKVKGFISAEFEYINFKEARYLSTDEADKANNNYYEDLNTVISNYYNNTLNIKIGGEISINNWGFRLGYANFPSPYSNTSFSAGKSLYTLGFGYRGRFSFIDFSLTNIITKDVQIPYRLSSLNNVYATINQNTINFNITWSFRF